MMKKVVDIGQHFGNINIELAFQAHTPSLPMTIASKGGKPLLGDSSPIEL
jgi:hypothetical protein